MALRASQAVGHDGTGGITANVIENVSYSNNIPKTTSLGFTRRGRPLGESRPDPDDETRIERRNVFRPNRGGRPAHISFTT